MPTGETVIENLDHITLSIDGTDVTNYGGVPIQGLTWDDAEPFGYKTLSCRFPNISPRSALPSWAEFGSRIVLTGTRSDDSVALLWRGIVTTIHDQMDESTYAVTLNGIGELYQGDFYVMPPDRPHYYPRIPVPPTDITAVVRLALNVDELVSWPLGEVDGLGVGTTTTQQGNWEPVLSGYIQELLTKAEQLDGTQWTLLNDPSPTAPEIDRLPRMHIKDRENNINRIECGSAGVTHDLELDSSQIPNVIYGEGVAPDGCHWYNLKFPGANVDDYTTGSLYLPLAWSPNVEPWEYDENGYITGPNPSYDVNAIRVEKYINFGNYITKDEGIEMATAMINNYHPPDWAGTLVCKADFRYEGDSGTFSPEDPRSRFEVMAGENIRYRNFRGDEDFMFHITQKSVDWDNQTATFTVDVHARDLMAYANQLSRNRENSDPSRKPQRTYRNSRAVTDSKYEWDCESGAGVISSTEVTAGEWMIYVVAMSEKGQVVHTEFELETAARFSVGVFDFPITAAFMDGVGTGNPLDADYWDDHGDSPGPVIAWGGYGDAAGFYPKSENDEDAALTGRHVDGGSWYYETDYPPWLWVAIWVESPATNAISGRFYPNKTQNS